MTRKRNKSTSSMPLWLQQAIIDHDTLETKIQKLTIFMQSDKFADLDHDEKVLYSVQQTTMMSLLNLIGARIFKHIDEYPDGFDKPFCDQAYYGEEFGITDRQLEQVMEQEEENEANRYEGYSDYIDVTKDSGLVS